MAALVAFAATATLGGGVPGRGLLTPPAAWAGRNSAPALQVPKRRVDPRTGLLVVPVEELAGAIKRKDKGEIARLAERIGPAALAEALRRPDPAVVELALTGILAIHGRERLLGPVTDLLAIGEPANQPIAARTLGEMLSTASAYDFDTWEVPPDVVAAACASLRTTALTPHFPTATRLAALDGLGDAEPICADASELIPLLKDPTPAIRRAAALVLRPQERLATGGFASGTRDIDKSVATASVAAMCEVLALPGTGQRGGPKEPIWDQTREAARRMVSASDTPPEDAVQMLDCLDPTLASDHKLLENLRSRGRTAPLGARASELLGERTSRPAKGPEDKTLPPSL